MAKNDKFKNDVRQAIDSGVRPVEFVFFPVTDFDGKEHKAYRAETVIHSTLKGEMPESYYTRFSDEDKCGLRLFKNSVVRLIEVLNKLKEAERQIDFISVYCSAFLVESIDFYETLKNLTKNESNDIKSKICIEFPQALTETDLSKAITAVSDIKALGMKTAVRCCGREDFPVTKLTKIMPNIVYTHPSVAEWVKEEGGRRLFSSFISFVTDMEISVIVEGKDEYKKATSGADCYGYLSVDFKPLSIEKIIECDKEDE